jgi:transglutaminase-like putative cysteine protease
MHYRILHRTTYSGQAPVAVGQNEAWLRPRELPWQTCLAYTLAIDPDPSVCVERTDYFGNTVAAFAFNGGYRELVVAAHSEVEVRPRDRVPAEATPGWEAIAAELRQPASPAALDAAQFVFDSPRAAASPALAGYALSDFGAGRPVLSAASDLTRRIHQEFQYLPESTTVSTPVEEVLARRVGVCQDFAHLEIAMLRSLGLAARYVSGYVRTVPTPGQPRLVGADASHAWLSVYCGSAGWVDVDPTNDLLPSEDHVTLAWGRDYSDVPPLRGVYIGGGVHQLQVEVEVEPLPAVPRE